MSLIPTIRRIKSLITSWNRGDGPRDGFYTNDSKTGVYFLRVNNLKNHSIDLTDVKYITRYVHENTLKRTMVTKGNLIFAISGTKDNLGTVSIVPDEITEANLNSALVRLDLDHSQIYDEYFTYFFDTDLARTQIDMFGKGAAQNNLNNIEISAIRVPVPDKKTQKAIIAFYRNAKIQKSNKEAEAKKILESINDYLMDELDIKLPDTSYLKSFITHRQNLSGIRFDPAYHQNFHEETIQSLKKSIFHWAYLKDLSDDIFVKGYLPNEGEKYGNNKVVQINSIDSEGNIDLNNLLTAKNVFHHNQRLNINDILIVVTGATIGKISLWDTEGDYWLGGDILKFKPKSFINPHYLFAVLKSKPLQSLIKRNITGATNGHLSAYDVRHLVIPVPNENDQKQIDKMNNIASEISKIRTQAKRLHDAAQKDFKEAKIVIEKMILQIN